MNSTYAQWLRYGAYTILVLAVVVGGYYFVYVQQRTEQLSNDRLALLQESSSYLTEEIGRIQRNIDNTLRDSSKVENDSTLRSALKEISGFTVRSGLSTSDTSEIEYLSKGCMKEARNEASLESKFGRSFSEPRLHFILKTDSPDADSTCRLGSTGLESLLAPLLPRSETAFENVFLARRDGRVLVSSGQGAISIEKLPLNNRGTVNQEATGDTSYTHGLYSEIFTMEAAGLSHRVFLQPFTVPVNIAYPNTMEKATAGEQEELYLAGVKQDQAFRAEAMMLPPTLLAILVGVVVLVLLAFPFLEVWLIGPTESFQGHDVFEVAVGVVIASSMVTLAALSVFCYTRLEEKQFSQLEELSTVIRTTLETEATAAGRQLKRLTKLVEKCDSNCLQQTRIWADTVKTDTSWVTVSDSVLEDRSSYPHLEMASWIDEEAMQVAKWSVEDQTTPLIDLSDRGYVRAHEAALQQKWTASAHSEVWEHPRINSTEWVLESIRSKNTGEVFAQVSRRPESPLPIRDTTATVSDSAVVSAATLPLLSVIDPVLPPHFQFAVIDEEGEVLFHSDTRRNLRENILDKVRGGAHLRDAVYARTAARATAQYREESYLFYSHPIGEEGSPWTLLVFAEVQPLRALHGHVLTSGLLLYVGYLLVLLVTILFWMTVDRRTVFGLRGLMYTIWPDRAKTSSYRTLLGREAGALLLGLVPVFGALFWGSSRWPLGLALLVAVLSIVLFFYHCSGREGLLEWIPGLGAKLQTLKRRLNLDRVSPSLRLDWPSAYVGSLLLLVLNVGVLPVLVSYTVLHNESAELMVKKNQRMFAERLQERGEKWVDYYRGADGSEQRIALNPTAREKISAHLFPAGGWTPGNTIQKGDSSLRPWDVHTVSGLLEIKPAEEGRAAGDGQSITSGDCGESTGAVQPITKFVGTSQRGASRVLPSVFEGGLWSRGMRQYSDSTSRDSSWVWEKCEEKGRLTFVMERARRGSLPPSFLADSTGGPSPDRSALRLHSTVPTVASLLGTSAGTGLLVVCFLVLLSVPLWWVLRVLHDQIFFIGIAPALEDGAESSSDPGRLEGPTRILYLSGHPESVTIDAAKVHDEGIDVEDLVPESPTAPVVVENFGHGLREAEVAERKRALLERLVELEVDVEVYSDVNPLDVLGDHFVGDDQTEPVPIDLDAWALVLRHFRLVPPTQTVDPDESLDNSQASHGLTDRQEKILERECQADPYLRRRKGQIRDDVFGNQNESALSETQIEEQVRYYAQAHYLHLWMSCTDEEKVILHRISTDGFVSPHSRRIVKQLLRRGLLVKDKHDPVTKTLNSVLRPMNESFRRFVAALDSPVIARYEKRASSTEWRRVRAPLLLGFALVIGFVFLTQPGLVEDWLGTLAPALAAGLPALMNVFSSIFGGGVAQGSGGG